MDCIGSEHALEGWTSINQVLMVFQIYEVVVDRVVNEGHLGFAAGNWFFQAKQLSKLFVYQVFSGQKYVRLLNLGRVVRRKRLVTVDGDCSVVVLNEICDSSVTSMNQLSDV